MGTRALLHRITSSARCRSDCGIARLIAAAVLRLMPEEELRRAFERFKYDVWRQGWMEGSAIFQRTDSPKPGSGAPQQGITLWRSRLSLKGRTSVPTTSRVRQRQASGVNTAPATIGRHLQTPCERVFRTRSN